MDRSPSTELNAAIRLRLENFELDLLRGELLDAEGRPGALRKQALDVLLALGANAGHVVSKAELMQRVWRDVVVTDDSLVQAVCDIRRVLGDREHRLVRTITRRGYRLVPSAPAPAIADSSAVDFKAAAPTVPFLAQRWKRWLPMAATLVLAVVGGASWWADSARASDAETAATVVLATATSLRNRSVVL